MGLAAGIATTIGVLGVAFNLNFAPFLTKNYGLLMSSIFTWILTIM